MRGWDARQPRFHGQQRRRQPGWVTGGKRRDGVGKYVLRMYTFVDLIAVGNPFQGTPQQVRSNIVRFYHSSRNSVQQCRYNHAAHVSTTPGCCFVWVVDAINRHSFSSHFTPSEAPANKGLMVRRTVSPIGSVLPCREGAATIACRTYRIFSRVLIRVETLSY